MKWLERSNIFTSTWLSSAQSSFIPKFLVNFWDKITRAQNWQDPKCRRNRTFWRKSLMFHWRKISYFVFIYIFPLVLLFISSFQMYIYIYIYVCIFPRFRCIYIYMYIYMHTCTYIHTCRQTDRQKDRQTYTNKTGRHKNNSLLFLHNNKAKKLTKIH